MVTLSATSAQRDRGRVRMKMNFVSFPAEWLLVRTVHTRWGGYVYVAGYHYYAWISEGYVDR